MPSTLASIGFVLRGLKSTIKKRPFQNIGTCLRKRKLIHTSKLDGIVQTDRQTHILKIFSLKKIHTFCFEERHLYSSCTTDK